MTDKYEKVTDMTVGQVVDAILSGTKFFFYMEKYNEYHTFDLQTSGILALDNWINQGRLYRKIEAPWWEKHKGGIVMARDCVTDMWVYVTFDSYKENSDYPFISNVNFGWKYMRPLTQAEKDAIITDG